MTHHQPDTDPEADASFERLLLRSASADALPEAATREAWAKFAGASAGVAMVAATAPGLGGVLHAARRASLKWLALGAIGGSAVTAAWMGTRNTPTMARTAASTPSAAIAASASALVPGNLVAPAVTAPTVLAPNIELALEPSLQRPMAHKQPLPGATATRGPSAPAALDSASSLAAEVSALDSVQRAIATRDFSRALRLVDEYHREFPRGQLTPDADALAIEAVEALGNRTELAIRAARFLSRYPKDPHATRIATLVEP